MAVLLALWLTLPGEREDLTLDPVRDQALLHEPDEPPRLNGAPHLRGVHGAAQSHAEQGPEPSGQHHVVRGRVMDALSGQAVADVRIVRSSPLDEVLDVPGRQREGQTTDADGRFRMAVWFTDDHEWTYDAPWRGSLKLEKAGYEPLDWPIPPRARTRSREFVHHMTRVVPVAGRVVDDSGRPMAGASLRFPAPRKSGALGPRQQATAEADDSGRFHLPTFPLVRRHPRSAHHAHVFASHPDALEPGMSIDVLAATTQQRQDLVITLRAGVHLRGWVEDADGRVLQGALVEVWDGTRHRRGARTDRDGRFELRRVQPGRTRLRVLHFDQRQRSALELTVQHAMRDVEIQTTTWTAATTEPQEVLGMQLVDATPALRDALFLPPHVGVVVVDPGTRVHALGLPQLRAGDGISHIAGADCASVTALLGHVRDHLRYHKSRTKVSLPIACEFLHENYGGSHSATLVLEAADLELLRK